MAGDDRPLVLASRTGCAERLAIVDQEDIGKLHNPLRRMAMVTYLPILGDREYPVVSIVVDGAAPDEGNPNSPGAKLKRYSDSLSMLALATGRLRSKIIVKQSISYSRGTFFFTTPTSARTASHNLLHEAVIVKVKGTSTERAQALWCDEFVGVAGSDRVSEDKFTNHAIPRYLFSISPCTRKALKVAEELNGNEHFQTVWPSGRSTVYFDPSSPPQTRRLDPLSQYLSPDIGRAQIIKGPDLPGRTLEKSPLFLVPKSLQATVRYMSQRGLANLTAVLVGFPATGKKGIDLTTSAIEELAKEYDGYFKWWRDRTPEELQKLPAPPARPSELPPRIDDLQYAVAVHLQRLFEEYCDELVLDNMYCTAGRMKAFDRDHAVYEQSTLTGQSGSPVTLLGERGFEGCYIGIHTGGGAKLGNNCCLVDSEPSVELFLVEEIIELPPPESPVYLADQKAALLEFLAEHADVLARLIDENNFAPSSHLIKWMHLVEEGVLERKRGAAEFGPWSALGKAPKVCLKRLQPILVRIVEAEKKKASDPPPYKCDTKLMLDILATKGNFADDKDLRDTIAPGMDVEGQMRDCHLAGVWLLQQIEKSIEDLAPLPTNALGLPGSGSARMATLREVIGIIELYYAIRNPIVFRS